jgi:enoyl-CoA hydratase/carnithine racemase
MSTPKEPVLLEDHGDYGLIRLNRPAQRNAMNGAARKGLLQCLERARGAHKVLIITGQDGSFCSGVDLKEVASATQRERELAPREWVEVLLAIRRHPAVFIAAVGGYALGGGVSLINVCDLAIAADEAPIGMPELGFGMYPAMAGPSTQMMLPAKRAAWMVLTADRIDGRTAAQWGLVNESVPLAQLEGAADALAKRVARHDAVALAESKRALEMVPKRIAELEPAFDYAMALNVGIKARTTAQAEGIAAFKDKA